ncbi:MAG: nucleotide exchange factor GrpE [Chitinispirillaceae bacterium]
MNQSYDTPLQSDDKNTDTTFVQWKTAVAQSFSAWLDELSPQDLPQEARDMEESDIPDLFSFYSSLAVLQVETKKLTRKTVESLGDFGKTIKQMDSRLPQVNSFPDMGQVHRIVNLGDRIARIRQQLEHPPRPRIFFNDTRWFTYHDSISRSIDLLDEHVADLLKGMGISRIRTSGTQFDPHLMIAVEVEHTTALPDNQVVEEISCGYIQEQNVIRHAEVKVARNKGKGNEHG